VVQSNIDADLFLALREEFCLDFTGDRSEPFPRLPADGAGLGNAGESPMDDRLETPELGNGEGVFSHLEAGSLRVGDAVVDTFAFAARRARTFLALFKATFGFALLIIGQPVKVGLIGKICSSANILEDLRMHLAKLRMILLPDWQSLLLLIIGGRCPEEIEVITTPMQERVVNITTGPQHLSQKSLLGPGGIESELDRLTQFHLFIIPNYVCLSREQNGQARCDFVSHADKSGGIRNHVFAKQEENREDVGLRQRVWPPIPLHYASRWEQRFADQL
jgi:hypothetical protein